MRKSALVDWGQWVATDIVLLILLVLFIFSRSVVVIDGGLGLHCTPTAAKDLKTLGPNEIAAAGSQFETRDYCWPSGIALEEGRRYEVWIDMVEPYFDRTIVSDIAGFKDFSLRHLAAAPLRRSMFADWFAPIAQIAPEGRFAWTLESVGGDTALDVGTDRRGVKMPKRITDDPAFADYLKQSGRTTQGFIDGLGVTSPIPAGDLAAADAIAQKYDLSRRYVSRFVAQSDGELFLYVNDAVIGYPWFRRWPLRIFEGFYANNSGKARVTVRRLDGRPTPNAAASGRPAEPATH